MKRNLIYKLIPIFLFLLVIIIFAILYFPRSFHSLLGTEETNITRVFMLNGNDGNAVETMDRDKIKELINLLNDRVYFKTISQSQSTGYCYYYDFYVDDENMLRITGTGDKIYINGKKYKVSKSISTEAIKDWFDSLAVNNSN